MLVFFTFVGYHVGHDDHPGVLDENRLAKSRLAQREPAESTAVGTHAVRLAAVRAGERQPGGRAAATTGFDLRGGPDRARHLQFLLPDITKAGFKPLAVIMFCRYATAGLIGVVFAPRNTQGRSLKEIQDSDSSRPAAARV